MFRVENEVVVDATVERMWEVTLDVESLPEVTPTVTEVERLDVGQLKIGSRTRLKQPGQRPAVWTVTEIDPPRRFVWETRSLGMRLVAAHEIDHRGDGCVSRVSVEAHGRFTRLVGPLLKPAIRKAITTENAGLKRTAEV